LNSQEHHIIRRQIIELDLPSRKDAYRQQRHVSQLFQEVVARRLGDHFDGLGLGDTVLRIPKLEVDLGSLSAHNFDRDFLEQCTLAIQKAVEDALRTAKLAQGDFAEDIPGTVPLTSAQLLQPAQSHLQALEQFLLTGTLPINRHKHFEARPQVQWEVLLAESPSGVVALLRRLATDSLLPVKRLVEQFTSAWIVNLLSALYGQASAPEPSADVVRQQPSLPYQRLLPTPLARYREIWTRLPVAVQQALIDWLVARDKKTTSTISKSSASRLTAEVLRILLTHAPANWVPKVQKTLRKMDSPIEERGTNRGLPQQAEPTAPEDPYHQIPGTTDRLLVSQAGIVLLHPFLPALFKQLAWVEEAGWINQACQERALHLLVYLATGAEQVGEHNFMLPKLLCAWPQGQAVNRFLELTDQEKAEGDRLLTAVLSHWKALGNSSIDGIREGFLQRTGLLEQRKDGHLLRIERKGRWRCKL